MGPLAWDSAALSNCVKFQPFPPYTSKAHHWFTRDRLESACTSRYSRTTITTVLRTWYFVLFRLVICLYILCTTTTLLLSLLIWLLASPDRYNGKADLPHPDLHLTGLGV